MMVLLKVGLILFFIAIGAFLIKPHNWNDPSIGGFAYVCWRLQELGVTAASMEVAPAWKRWLLTPSDVAALMADLAQHGVIGLNRAGSVVRIEWRAASLTEAVHAAA